MNVQQDEMCDVESKKKKKKVRLYLKNNLRTVAWGLNIIFPKTTLHFVVYFWEWQQITPNSLESQG